MKITVFYLAAPVGLAAAGFVLSLKRRQATVWLKMAIVGFLICAATLLAMLIFV